MAEITLEQEKSNKLRTLGENMLDYSLYVHKECVRLEEFIADTMKALAYTLELTPLLANAKYQRVGSLGEQGLGTMYSV